MPLTAVQQAQEELRRRQAAEGQPTAPAAPAAAAATPMAAAQAELARKSQPPGVIEDVTRSAGAGLRRGVEGIPGMLGDVPELAGKALAWGAGKVGAGEDTQAAIADYARPDWLPGTEDIHQFTTPLFGKSYEPQTTAGKYAETAGEFAPGFVGGGGIVKNAARLALGAGAGVASEAAGQATEGTRLEPWARVGTGILAGGAPEALQAGKTAIRQAPMRAAEIAAEDAAEVHGVRPTKGQRSGDVTQQQKEEQMLHGAKGSWAQRLLEGRKRENLEALKDSSARLQDHTAPTRGATPADSGGNLNWSTRRRVAQKKQQGGADIEGALNSGVMIDANRLRSLPKDLETNLAGPTPYVPDVVIDGTTPIAKQAMDRVRTFASQADDPAVKELSLAGAEQLRRNLGKLQAKDPTDARALRKVMEHFDDWLEGSVSHDPATHAQLKSGRQTYKEGVQVERPRGSPVGGKQVADIATTAHAEDTARLFKPNDRGELSPTATDALDRLTAIGADAGDLDQVRGIVLDHLMTGDPGKVATRITNFSRNNPTAAEKLFTRDELASIKAWGDTNKTLVPNPLATNPSKSSYGVIKEMGKLAGRQATTSGGIIGSLLGGPVGAMIGAGAGLVGEGVRQGKGFLDARKALAPANRDTLAQEVLKGGRKGAMRATPGAVQALTINDPEDPNDGEPVEIISEGKSGYKVRLRNGQEKIIGKELVH